MYLEGDSTGAYSTQFEQDGFRQVKPGIFKVKVNPDDLDSVLDGVCAALNLAVQPTQPTQPTPNELDEVIVVDDTGISDGQVVSEVIFN